MDAKVYKDIFHVALGPFGKKIFKGGLGIWMKRFSWVFKHFLKLSKENLHYGNRAVIGESEMNNKIWLLVGSKNNYDSLKFLKEHFKESVWISTNKKSQRDFNIPARISLHKALFNWFGFLGLILKIQSSFGKMIFLRPDSFFEGIGQYEAALKLFEKHRPSLIVFSNDHYPFNRAVLLAARQSGISTAYIQHASVSELFPPLKFDLNLLEGKDSLDKYAKCGPIEGKVHLVGMPKFDKFHVHRNFKESIQEVGICFSLLDDIEKIKTLASAISINFPNINLAIRPHPRDERSFEIAANTSISNSKKEGVFDFLSRMDVIIAGDTSTHLEAVLLNVDSLYFPFNEQMDDYYSYEKNGLVQRYHEVDEIIKYLKKIQEKRPLDTYLKAKYYNALIGTKLEGKSREVIIHKIEEFLNS